MSHATTKIASSPLCRNAAWIPPSAPIPGKRSGTRRHGRKSYRPGSPVATITSSKSSSIRRRIASMNRPPWYGRSALSLPIRLERPPARITPVTPGIFACFVEAIRTGWV